MSDAILASPADREALENIEVVDLRRWTILAGYRGSHAHGMYVPPDDPTSTDDVDFMHIVVPPPDHYVGLRRFGSQGTREIKRGSIDLVAYEVSKFIRLLLKGNPNVLSLLWVDMRHRLAVTRAGQMLLDARDLFASKAVYHSLVGYAHGQMHRMEHSACQGYMGEKRKRLIEKFGYDTKNAAHLIRLLRMGVEFLDTGSLRVLRTSDRDDLLAIKRGDWPLENVKALADSLFADARGARDRSALPDAPDEEAANDLCCAVIRAAWQERGDS